VFLLFFVGGKEGEKKEKSRAGCLEYINSTIRRIAP
jgi:hypothetical protein